MRRDGSAAVTPPAGLAIAAKVTARGRAVGWACVNDADLVKLRVGTCMAD
jgi:hypothetical protein